MSALMLCKAYKQKSDKCKETNTMLWHKEIDIEAQVQSLDLNSNGKAQMRHKKA